MRVSISFSDDGRMVIVEHEVIVENDHPVSHDHLVFHDHVYSADLTTDNDLIVVGCAGTIGSLAAIRLTCGGVFIGRMVLDAIHDWTPQEWTV